MAVFADFKTAGNCCGIMLRRCRSCQLRRISSVRAFVTIAFIGIGSMGLCEGTIPKVITPLQGIGRLSAARSLTFLRRNLMPCCRSRFSATTERDAPVSGVAKWWKLYPVPEKNSAERVGVGKLWAPWEPRQRSEAVFAASVFLLPPLGEGELLGC